MIKQTLKELIGDLPAEIGFKKRMRLHQAWWRACILAEEQGQHPIRKKEFIGSTIQERKAYGGGIIEENRLFNNLLSSQPLCFNFFGELKMDLSYALQALQRFYPEITSVNRVIFEYAPKTTYK
jgi:hypothetical protein